VITLYHFLAVGAILFGLGFIGFLTRRNLITMFLSAELMLQGVLLNFLAFGYFHGNLTGQVFALFIITVAACEAGLGLALFLVLYRRSRTLDSAEWQNVREAGLPPTVDTDPLDKPELEEAMPTLPVAGRKPDVAPTEGANRV
jgi:NADH-quinone oxidoreductase subunit K